MKSCWRISLRAAQVFACWSIPPAERRSRAPLRAAAGAPEAVGAKALIVSTRTGFAMFVLPGHLRIDSRTTRAIVGKYRFANSEEVRMATNGLEIGTIPPFARPVFPKIGTLARDWIAGTSVALILGDNIFYGNGIVEMCLRAKEQTSGATVFGYRVDDPERYGVIGFDADGRVTSLEEKPAIPRSNCSMTGLYFFDGRVCDLAAGLRPSARGELEITDLARCYLERGDLRVEQMGRGFAWLDTGTQDSLLEAAKFVRTIQHRQGIQIACLEEIAYHQGLITADQAHVLAAALAKSPYGAAILRAIEGRRGQR